MILTRALFALTLISGVSRAETLETWSCDSVDNPIPCKQQWYISDKGIQVIGCVRGTSEIWKIAQNDDKVAIGWFTAEVPYHLYVILDKKAGTLIEIHDSNISKGTDVIPITTFVNHCIRE